MLQFALVGNPNSGKTTLFNALTGSTARVGNWPGVTVDKKEGAYKKGGVAATIVDLPGVYSLSPYTPEEVIARDFILTKRPDCIVDIVDATNLERNLYLTTQLLELDVPIIVALNMTDGLSRRGDCIDVSLLERRLGVPVVEISALRNVNVDELMQRAMKTARKPRAGRSVLRSGVLGAAIETTAVALRQKGVFSPLFHATKIVEGDEIAIKNYRAEARDSAALIRARVGKDGFDGDVEAAIANVRYEYVTARLSPALTRARGVDEYTASEMADRWITHKQIGIPLFFLILFALFHLTFSADFLYLGRLFPAFGAWCKRGSAIKTVFFQNGLCSPGVLLRNVLTALTDGLGRGLKTLLRGFGCGEAVVGLLCDGVWGGVSSVLQFLPQVLVLFLLFSLLEDSGYMARVAFLFDRIFRRFGVSGRAFLPMIMGFGCSVPAMLNTRTLGTQRERTATIRVIPFFCCSAKMPILLAAAGAIVTAKNAFNADMVVCFMYFLGVFVAFSTLFFMNKQTPQEESPFIMELPDYRLPSVKNLAIRLWDKIKRFLQKAFTLVTLSCVAVWCLAHFSWDWRYVADVRFSMLVALGKLLQPLFTPLGFGGQLKTDGWVFAVAALAGTIAKEDVVATLGTLAASLGAIGAIDAVGAQTENGAQLAFLAQHTGITAPALLAFAVFNLLTIPCFATVATARAELDKKTFQKTLLFWFVTSYLVSAAVYTIGAWWWTAFVWVAALAIGYAAKEIFARQKKDKIKKKKRVGGCKNCNRCKVCNGCAVRLQ